MVDPTPRQRWAAELLGTAVLVLLGCGSIAYAGQAGVGTSITAVGLTFGLTLSVLTATLGRVSGGHFNPAVSVGAAASGRMPWREVGGYVLAQVVGAVAGALLLFLLLQGYPGFEAQGAMGQNAFGAHGSGYAWWAAFLLEMVLTAVLVLVFLTVISPDGRQPAVAPLLVGLTLAALSFVALPATVASFNPARSIGPALFAGGDAIVQLWLFILAPLLGGVLGGLAHPALLGREHAAVPGSGLRMPRPRPRAARAQQDSHAVGVTAYAAEPIVQDGWQWDPVGQQWHPVGSTPEQWRAQQAAEAEAAARNATVEETEDATRQWPDSDAGDGGTQIRPPR